MTLERKNAFSPEKAKSLGVPVTEWKKLQEGETVRAGGRKIRPEEVFGASRKGITAVFSTDTRPCETLRKYTKDADLLILEGMYADEEKRPQALKNHHMMFSEAAQIAREAAPAALLLTHFSTSLEDPESGLDAAREIFQNTWTAKDGETVTLRYPAGEEKAWISLC
jgi:ribonuclease Z